MKTFSIAVHFMPYFLFFCFLNLLSKPISTFSFQTFLNSPNFDSEVALFGDAVVVNGGSSVKLTNPSVSSSGFLMHAKPIAFLESNPRKLVSFSTDFSFSISSQNGDGIAFLIVPNDFSGKFSREKRSYGVSRGNRFLGIEFDTSKDDTVGDLNANHVGIDLGSLVSVRVSNVSSINLVLNNGATLRSWIDYDASSKRLEVRLSEMGNARPYDPLLTHLIDLSEMWMEEEVFVGISSSNGNSLQTSSVFSWNFRAREVPRGMHSQPVDPQVFAKEDGKIHSKRSFCPSSILAGLIFATGCGALMAFVVLFVWTIFVGRHKDEYVTTLPVNFRYEKINVGVDNCVDVKN